MSTSRLVYSTANNTCNRCRKPLKQCRCTPEGQLKSVGPQDGIVRIRRETKGRKGKGVTLIIGVAMDEAGLKQLAKQLKTLCGSGGSIKEGVIELQGDHREQIHPWLERHLEQKVKLAGG
jgi:translation initiation factor 1